ncbi:MAG: hypothetical protein MZW92_79135 [Comamonadaceae bacterium]|nr:hypothetical protein [Comamonadaceae bacterium]
MRFGQEIAGVMELGMASRGEHSEITDLRRPHGRLRAVGQHDRPVPGRRADLASRSATPRAPGSCRAASR